MTAQTTRRVAYWLAALLAAAYAGYVLVSKLSGHVGGGFLGEVGEACLVLASVTAFSVALFADERVHAKTPNEPPHQPP